VGQTWFQHQSIFFTQNLLHREAFAQRSFYTQQALTQRSSYTEKLLHTESFCTEAFTQRSIYTAFTHRSLYLHSFYTQRAFTQRSSYTRQLIQYPEPDLPPRGGYGLRIIARHEEVRTVIQSLQTGILPDVPDVWIS